MALVMSHMVGDSCYLEDSRSAHDQSEGGRKVWSNDFHEHRKVVEHICEEPGRVQRQRTEMCELDSRVCYFTY